MIWTIVKHEEVVIRRGGKPNGQLPSEIYLADSSPDESRTLFYHLFKIFRRPSQHPDPQVNLFLKYLLIFSAISEHKCMFLSCSYSSKSSWDPLSKIWGYSFYYLKYKNPAILCSFTKLLHHFLSSALTQKHLSSRATVLREVNDCIWQYTIIDLRVTSMMV